MRLSHRLHRIINVLLVISLITSIYPIQLFAQPIALQNSSTDRVGSSDPIPAQQVLGISRSQTSYQAGGTVTIVYTVKNLLMPVNLPVIPDGATITDTVAIIDAYDVNSDPNTLHNVLVENMLTPEMQLLADNLSDEYRWSLGSLPPMQSKSISMTVQAPASSATFVELDGGARAYAAHNGRRVEAIAAPAVIAPDGFDQWLISTIDANLTDEYVVAKSAELPTDPAAIFSYVQSLDYNPYLGSLRGARGTIWSEAGNSADQASLLIALLRLNGIPARYRHGTLTQADAQTVLEAMFPEPTQYLGVIDNSLLLSDPLNDPELIALAQDHWWVEAYLPSTGTWTDLDPVFPGAAIGTSYVSTVAGDGTDRIAELPDGTRHKVELALRVEKYNPLFGGTGLKSEKPLSTTVRTVEVVGEPLTFANLVTLDNAAGLIFATQEYTYVPYFLIGEEPVFGEAYVDIFSNFPFATVFHTGAWLNVTVTDPNGHGEQFEREIVDKIGYEARNGLSPSNVSISNESAQFVTDLDIFTTHVLPSNVPSSIADERRADALAAVSQLNRDSQRLVELFERRQEMRLSPEESAEYNLLRSDFQDSLASQLDNLGITWAESADRYAALGGQALLLNAFYDTPRIVTAATQVKEGQLQYSMDLRQTGARTIVHPGQPLSVGIGYNSIKGYMESELEGRVLESVTGTPAVSTARIWGELKAQDIETVYLTSDNLYALDLIDISAEARARVTQATLDGKMVMIPSSRVMVDGSSVIGWWEVDVETGETIGVLEDGTHGGALDYILMQVIGAAAGMVTDFILGFTSSVLSFVTEQVLKVFGESDKFDRGQYLEDVNGVSTKLACLGAGTGSIYSAIGCTGAIDFFGYGQQAGNVFVSFIEGADPPLPGHQTAIPHFDTTQSTAVSTVAVAATLGGGTLQADLNTDFVRVSAETETTFTSSGLNQFTPTNLAVNGTIYDSGGVSLGTGLIVAEASDGSSFNLAASPAETSLDGTGAIAFYASDFAELGAGNSWDSYVAQLSGTYSLTLTGVDVAFNGFNESGDFTVTSSSTATVTGTGTTPAPNFANSAAVALTDGVLTVAPATGTATLGGIPLDLSNGLAIADYSGTLTATKGTAATDNYQIDGGATLFTLETVPAATATNPATAVSFDADIATNVADTYTVSVTAPDGWDVTLSAAGAVTALPPAGTAAGDYLIDVVAQAAASPALALSTSHVVTVNPFDDFELDLVPEPLISIPMGPLQPTEGSNSTNTGQAQVTEAAYTIYITNTANAPHTYTVDVTGLPAGWTLLGKDAGSTTTSLSLPAGGFGRIGLYVTPDSFPAAGTTHPVNVQVTSDTAQVKTDSETFVMPAVPFNFIELTPQLVQVEPNSSAEISVTVHNVGNASASFPVTATSAFTQLVPMPLNPTGVVPAGGSDTQLLTLNIGDVPPGALLPITVDSGVPGSEYVQSIAAQVFVLTGNSIALNELADTFDSCAADDMLSGQVRRVATAMSVLESACSGTSCNSLQRDAVTGGVSSLLAHLASEYPTVDTAAVAAANSTLASSNEPSSILAALPVLTSSIEALEAPVCEVGQSRPSASFTPSYQAALTGSSRTVTLTVNNAGTLTTTYEVTTTMPTGNDVQQVTLAPSESAEIVYSVNSVTPQLALLNTTVRSVDGVSVATANAAVKFVDQFIQLLAVNPTPDFVETGVSQSEIAVVVENNAGIPLAGTAQVTALAPDGSTQASAASPVNLNNTTNNLTLNTFNTSGWDAGIYTITVNIVDENDVAIDDGGGYGLLNVGVGINASQSVLPAVVAPGNVTATTFITTELTDLGFGGGTGSRGAADSAPVWEPTSLRNLPAGFSETVTNEFGEQVLRSGPAIAEAADDEVMVTGWEVEETDSAEIEPDSAETPLIQQGTANAARGADAVTRYEETDAAIVFTGAVGSLNSSYASSGSYVRMDQIGETATFTTTSTWVNIGFAVGTGSGIADIYVDGVLTDTIDLYNHDSFEDSHLLTFDVAATRVISIAATDTRNPFASSDRVNIDYIDTWDGTSLPDGTFEQNDARVLLGSGWSSFNDVIASGGSFSRTTQSSAWFHFTGDSVGFQTLATPTGGSVRVYVDGNFITTISHYNPTVVTQTHSFDGFGPGVHTLWLESYRGNREYIDAFFQPGLAPFYAESDTGIVRIEEDDPRIRYNGVPIGEADDVGTSWGYVGSSVNSDGWYVRSSRAGDTAELDFEGDWIGVGFGAGNRSGIAEIYVDGVLQERVDLYRWNAPAESVYYDGFGPGSHTISVTVTADRNPFAIGNRINIDYFDTWDGTTEPTGVVTPTLTSEDRPILSGGWISRSSGGFTHLYNGASGSIWYPFSGDSVSFDAIMFSTGGLMEVLIDGELITRLDHYAPFNVHQTYAFTTTTSGPHVLQLRALNGRASVESFSSPAAGPYVDIAPQTGIIHREEYHPDIRYNGAPLTATTTTFADSFWTGGSGGKAIRTETLSDTISLEFNGTWVAMGLLTWSGGGLANVYIDGVFQEQVDFYTPDERTKLLTYDLPPGDHLIELVALAQQNPLATNDRIYLDFIDTWDGSAEPDGWTNFTRINAPDNISSSNNWTHFGDDRARDGEYYFDGVNAWYRFTGESFSLRAFSRQNVNAGFELFIDGVSQGVQSTYYRLTETPLVFTYDGLTDGPHLVRVNNVNINGQSRADIDAFEANPTTPDPGYPMVEWEEIANTGNILNTPAAGDVDEDGIVEIVATTDNGELLIYRGDGAEATGTQAIAGTPIEFKIDLGGEPDSVALADLDGQPGSEIAVGFPEGFAVYSFDGTNWAEQWFTDTVRSTWRAPAIGNIDADPEPEIVTSGNDCVCILSADGTELIRINRPAPPIAAFSNPLPPNLADLNGDGRLDILTGDGTNLFVFTTTLGTPELWWTRSYTDTLDGRGTPAIADIDGHLPGGDDAPEIVFVTSQHIIAVEAENGDIIWQYPTGGGSPGGVSIADLTGDGLPNIVATAQNGNPTGAPGKVYMLDAEGNEVWTNPANDGSSANSVSVLDLDGDGIWEVVWNGESLGLTVWRGSDGAVLFNEPLINSQTRMDYPIVVDVDGDGSAEIVTGDNEGLFVVGWDPVWANSRSIWNQYNYHITNINDDLSVPIAELDSWDVHNTYRTQTPLANVLPVYDVVVTHTVPTTGVAVQSATATRPFEIDGNPYGWNYAQAYYQPVLSNQFEIVLDGMQPGEVRQVSTETVVEYTLPSGSNRLTLPPLYVRAASLVALAPLSQTVGAGAAVSYTVTLSNPTGSAGVYTPTVDGVPPDWLSGVPTSVNVPANGMVTFSVVVTTPSDATGAYVLVVGATTSSGGSDQAVGQLLVVDALDLSITPPLILAGAGESASYTMTVTNKLNAPTTVQLSASGAPSVTLPASVSVPAASSVQVAVTAKGFTSGQLPFTVTGINTDGASDSASAVLDVIGSQQVALALNPDPVLGGPGMPSQVGVLVTNTGDAFATYALEVAVPVGWVADLDLNQVVLAPRDSAEIILRLTPPVGTPAGNVNYTVTATAQTNASARTAAQPATASAVGTVQIGNRGVQLSVDPASRLALPTDSLLTWAVTITNSGSIQDTFVLTTTGIVALSGSFSQDTVTLNAGESTTVQLTATDFSFVLPETYEFDVKAFASDNAAIMNVAEASITFASQEAVELSISPPELVAEQNEEVAYLATITNTGNSETVYDLSWITGATATGDFNRVTIPPNSTVQVRIVASGSTPGTYLINGQAQSADASATDQVTLIILAPTAVSMNTGVVTHTTAIALWLFVLVGLTTAQMLRVTYRRRKTVEGLGK